MKFIALRLFIICCLISFALAFQLYGQNGSGDGKGKGMGGGRPQVGRFYGKVFDNKGKSLEFATVRIYSKTSETDTALTLINGIITERNGDFILDNIPAKTNLVLKISAIGFAEKTMDVAFDTKQGGKTGPIYTDKDLGNISLSISQVNLGEVVVDGSEPDFKFEIDKRVYNVDKNAIAAGGTAEDAIKNIPSVAVDLDGNVTLRNAAPQIFVDNRPTNLTLEQIPADAIEKIEVITNPSAKFDASGGGAGILNIVLKKSKRIGYNGSIRGGIDKRAKTNWGFELNMREKKINVFINANLNQRKSISSAETERLNKQRIPITNMIQNDESISKGYFYSLRGGVDYFLDVRNTFTVSASTYTGQFAPYTQLNSQTDTVYELGMNSSFYKRITQTKRSNTNIGGSILYKHLYTKNGKELTADVNYQESHNKNNGSFLTQYTNPSGIPNGTDVIQQQEGSGNNKVITLQTDLTNPLNEKLKYESGIRANARTYENYLTNYFYVDSLNDYIQRPTFSDKYNFTDYVYAGYFTLSYKPGKMAYQVGLRLESSEYIGQLPDSNLSFKQTYPVNLFPNAFVSYALNEKNDLNINYSRKINRPNFFQILPYIDYSDSLNLRVGNPNLKPEFTNSVELSHQHQFGKGSYLLTSAYYKFTNQMITSYQKLESDVSTGRNAILNTYLNANNSYSYGLEITSRNNLTKNINLTTSFNLFYTVIDGSNITGNLKNERTSWVAKENINYKLSKSISFQVSFEYFSKTALGMGGGGRMGGGGGGMHFGGGSSSTAQGYTLPRYSFDVSAKYEFGKNKMASISFNVSDLLKTRRFSSYSESDYFEQTSDRVRDPLFYRLNFAYRFGKFDASLFRRKNTRSESEEGGM